MIDDKYLRILAAVYYLSNENPNRPTFLSNEVAALLGVDADGLLVLLRYLVSRGLLDGDPLEIYTMPVALTAAGTDYIESPLDALRTVEKSLIQTNTINVGGDFNAINSIIAQKNKGSIPDTDIRLALENFDQVLQQLPPDVVSTIQQDLAQNRDSLARKLRAGDRLGAAGIISGLAKVVSIAKDFAVLIQTLPIIYHGIRLLFHLS